MPEIKQDIRAATFVVAANDSLHKNDADYVCDGVADNVEIQAAINALPASGGVVHLSEGTFKTSAEIVILSDNVNLIGSGRGTIIETQAATNAIRIGSAAVQAESCYIGHLTLNGKAYAGLIGLYVKNGVENQFENLYVTKFKNWGIQVEYNHSNFFYGCSIYRNGDGVLAPYSGGIKFGSELAENNTNTNANLLLKCTIEENENGVWLVQGTGNSIKNCVIEGNDKHGLILDRQTGVLSAPNITLIEGCYFELNNIVLAANIYDIFGEKAIFGLTIRDCNFDGNKVAGNIHLDCSAAALFNFVLDHNNFTDGTVTNLHLEVGAPVAIENNWFTSACIMKACYGIKPLDISQWYDDPSECFTTIENSTSSGLTVYVPSKYNIAWELSKKFTFPANNITIYGDGSGSVLKLANGVNDDMFYASGRSGLKFMNLYLDVNKTNNAGADGISLATCTECEVDGCIINDAHVGIYFGAACNDNRIRDNRFLSCTTPINISVNTCNRNMVHDNNWYSCTNDMANSGTNTRITTNIDIAGARWLVDDDEVVLKVSVAHDNQNPAIATIPAGSFVTAELWVNELFDSDGTDLLTIGYAADPDSIMTSLDVSSVGRKTIAYGVEGGYMGTARAIEAYYVAGGSAPTTGHAVVVLRITRSPTP